MIDKLGGWDLLTWRLGYENKGVVPLVGAQITISGHIDFEKLLKVVNDASNELEVLRLALSNERFPKLTLLSEFDVKECVEVVHHHTNPAEFALRHATTQLSPERFREDLPLWRMYVVYKESETLLFTFLHHAVADGRKALDTIYRLCNEQVGVPKIKSQSQSTGITTLFEQFVSNPVSIMQNFTPALLGLNSLIALSPQHTLPQFASRSFRDNVIQYSLPTTSLQLKARELSVSNHDISVAITLETIYVLEQEMNTLGDGAIRVNVPVAFKQANYFNELVISRLFVPRLNFSETAQMYRKLFQAWKEHPSLKMYGVGLDAISQVEEIDITSFATHSDITVSSLPRIPNPLKLAGNAVLAIWPLVPTMGSAFNFTTIAFMDSQYFTLTYDAGIKIDQNALRRAIRLCIEKNLGIVPNFQHQL